jgi:hypothetical protein
VRYRFRKTDKIRGGRGRKKQKEEGITNPIPISGS